MNALDISLFSEDSAPSGGKVCSIRNLELLKDCFGVDNVTFFKIHRDHENKNTQISWIIKNAIKDILNIGFSGLDKKQIIQIKEIIRVKSIHIVFLDSSLLGSVAKKIKKQFPSVKIITYFHNTEYLFFKQLIKTSRKFLFSYRIILSKLSEIYICRYSDIIIAMNLRDAKVIEGLYKRYPDYIIPISIKDCYNDKHPQQSDIVSSEKLKVLFIGSYFFPNVQGIKWFIERVIPFSCIELKIIGSQMELLSNEIIIPKGVEILSNVPSLKAYYEEADIVILPIFSGSGMKVKTCEALMYGKYMIGTKEAFTGYQINDNFSLECNTAEEFISALNNFKQEFKFNSDSRETYNRHYSYSNSQKEFRNIIQEYHS